MSTQRVAAAHPATSPHTRLTGHWLHVMWALWIAVALLTLYATATGIVAFVTDWAKGAVLTERLARTGISPSVFFPLDLTLNLILLLMWWVAAVFLVWRRPNDWLVFTTSALILAISLFATSFDNAMMLPSAAFAVVMILDAAVAGCILLFFGTFPDGRFVPRWLLPVFIILFIYLVAENVWRLILGIPYPEGALILRVIRYPVVHAVCLFAQIYRLVHSSAEARQQTKLAVLGFASAIVGNLLEKFVLLDFGPRVYLVARPITTACFIACIVLLLYALLRYRIWDIEFVINRSLVYGGLSVVLGAVFAGGFLGLRTAAEAILGSEQTGLALGLSAAVVAGLFAPTRDRLRRFVDRRFYGIELDYRRAVREQAAWEQAQRREIEVKTRIGIYTNLELLGRGGMGEVYRAQHPTLKNYLAIKVLPQHLAGDEKARKRFMREAQTIARLKHPNIVGVHDYGEWEGLPYMVMECVEGENLSDVLKKRGRLPLDEAWPLLQDIASALDYAHENGIVHRDIKPSNVMIEPVTTPGNSRAHRAVLTDFGIAKLYSALTRLTGSGGLIGTLDYIAPEQIKGARDVDRRADVYSLGVMTYQTLVGELPFKHSNLGAMVMAHLMQPPPDPRKGAPDLAVEAAAAIVRAMAKEPEARYATAGEFVMALRPGR